MPCVPCTAPSPDPLALSLLSVALEEEARADHHAREGPGRVDRAAGLGGLVLPRKLLDGAAAQPVDVVFRQPEAEAGLDRHSPHADQHVAFCEAGPGLLFLSLRSPGDDDANEARDSERHFVDPNLGDLLFAIKLIVSLVVPID